MALGFLLCNGCRRCAHHCVLLRDVGKPEPRECPDVDGPQHTWHDDWKEARRAGIRCPDCAAEDES